MIISISLLKDFLQFPYSPEELCIKLTAIGIEVEGIVKKSPAFKGIMSTKIINIEKISNSNLLKVIVNTSRENVSVVTAAANLNVGDIVPLALPGSEIAGGNVIETKEFRGITSHGMLCSYSELGLEPDSLSSWEKEGIFIFPDDTPVGKPVDEILPLEDTFLELSLLPDRADAFCVRGLARWIEVLLARDQDRPADFSRVRLEPFAEETCDKVFPVEIDDMKLCDVYSARIIKNVKVRKSSLSLRRRLLMLGVRPVNNVVDVTNYMTKVYGQPLHSFDLDTLDEKIIVRRAKSGEKLVTLDGVERTLSDSNLLIADREKPVAIAGVMGGELTSVRETTTNILLESAHFNPQIISKSSRKILLTTDASTLFEKGTDPALPSIASKVAAYIIGKETGGTVCKENVVRFSSPRKTVALNLGKATKLLGALVTEEEASKCLSWEGIEHQVSENGVMAFPPSFRQDLNIEEDLIEEIVRMKGYNEFGETPIVSALRSGQRTEFEEFIWTVKDTLAKAGLMEVYTSSLTSESILRRVNFTCDNPVRVDNPISEDMSILRPSLLATMFSVVERNINFQNTDIAIFEIGNVFEHYGSKPIERTELGIALCGNRVKPNGFGVELRYNFFYLKGLLEQLLEMFQVDVEVKPERLDFFHPYQSATLFSKNTRIGYLGKIIKTVSKELYFACLDLQKIYELRASAQKTFKQYSSFPAVKRDIAILVESGVPESQVRSAILALKIPELKRIDLFDVYEGAPLPEGKKNLAYSLEFSSMSKTLRGEEVDDFVRQIEKALASKVKGELRKK